MMIQVMIYLTVLLSQSDWGFFGHRLINRVAVYTVPSEMMGWYKPYIDYIAEHAVDPDKRRYATKHEAVRHYIDLDHWGCCLLITCRGIGIRHWRSTLNCLR